MVLAWYHHSVLVPRLDDHRINWKLFTMAANANQFNGRPDAYTELHIVTAIATPSGRLIDDGSTTPYADLWQDVRVQRAWMRFMIQQQQWANDHHAFMVAHSFGKARFAGYVARATEAMASYARFQEEEFTNSGIFPSGVSGTTARRLSDRVGALKRDLNGISLEWGNALRLERERAILQEFLLGLIGVVLLAAAIRPTAQRPSSHKRMQE